MLIGDRKSHAARPTSEPITDSKGGARLRVSGGLSRDSELPDDCDHGPFIAVAIKFFF